jgi:acetyl esterase/lipase
MLLGDRNWVVPFNKQVLIPELRAAGKILEVIDYPGEPHCFCFLGHQRPAAALKAFRDMDGFCRRHIATKPRPLDSDLVKIVPL